MNTPTILDEAARILRERNGAYGEPAECMAAVAARWSTTLGVSVTPAQVVLCMIDLKLARLAHDPGHHDSALDVIGYAALLGEVCP
ncbi:MAG TPA: DUF6378 domain-containing protein [Sedimentisphaerales bacterium]|nr:DUF6378 domain-containing protein [Sedimentisphaerales bacterium]